MFETYNVKQSQNGHGKFSSVILPTCATKKGVPIEKKKLTKIKHTNPKSTLPETNLSLKINGDSFPFGARPIFRVKTPGLLLSVSGSVQGNHLYTLSFSNQID